MSGRDLLYKPPVPLQLPEDEKPGEKKAKGVRDLGGVAGEVARRPASGEVARTPAYKAAYFNRDISGVRDANPRAKPMAALRGSEHAVDLKKVVLPPAIGVETPDPGQLRAASDLMDVAGQLTLDLQNLVGRQKGWLLGKGVTAEIIQARLAQLKEMVEARKIALRRMLQRRNKRAASVTLDQAAEADGHALEHSEDVVKEGSDLVRRVGQEAEGMHQRIAKMLGIKR